MARLEPIPTPLSIAWREFRIRVLPLLVFACLVAGLIHLWPGQREKVVAPRAAPDSGLATTATPPTILADRSDLEQSLLCAEVAAARPSCSNQPPGASLPKQTVDAAAAAAPPR